VNYPLFSIIIPVYNRPEELNELLASIDQHLNKLAEIIIVDDGSDNRCDHVADKYTKHLDVTYIYQSNSGPGPARNTGAKRAMGKYLIFLDSDCTIPPHYTGSLTSFLSENEIAIAGGPDRDHPGFSPIQKAISYAMTSVLTTGGIRGRKKSADVFYPRSFNMIVDKVHFEKAGGFSDLRFGEDLDLSMKIIKSGGRSALIPDAWVYHKRRSTFRQFFKQVFNSGKARIFLNKRHPGTLKPVHTLPALFTIYLIFSVLTFFWQPALSVPLISYLVINVISSLFLSQSLSTSLLSVPAVIIQLTGYGSGFLVAIFQNLTGKAESYGFEKNFYD